MSNKAPRSKSEVESKLRKVRLQLEQFQEFKRILREDGLSPDMEDKQKESRLIQKVIGFEKDLKRFNQGITPDETSAPAQKFARARLKASKRD